MDGKLELHYKLSEISNKNLDKEKLKKEEMIREISNSDILSATLKAHMYIERELILLYEYFFGKSKVFDDLRFASKLKMIYELGIINQELYDVIDKLNKIRNNCAHNLCYLKDNNVYKILSDSLSGFIKKYHKIETESRRILYGEISDETKYKILLAQIWIQFVIFCSSKESKKMKFGERLIEELKSDIEKT